MKGGKEVRRQERKDRCKKKKKRRIERKKKDRETWKGQRGRDINRQTVSPTGRQTDRQTGSLFCVWMQTDCDSSVLSD